jgi:hypothetical protein
VEEFKDAVFLYESSALPPELQIVDGVAERFAVQPESETTLIHLCHSLEEAAEKIDWFKAKTCGSAYSLAIININMMTHVDELKFLLRGDVVGDPRTIFLASLRYMVGDIYAFARDKVTRESDEEKGRSPSCISTYGATSREDTWQLASDLCTAYLREADERAKARARGETVLEGKAEEMLRKSGTAFHGKNLRRPPGMTGVARPVGGG